MVPAVWTVRATPAAKSPIEIAIEGALVTQAYVRNTLALMRAFGEDVHQHLAH